MPTRLYINGTVIGNSLDSWSVGWNTNPGLGLSLVLEDTGVTTPTSGFQAVNGSGTSGQFCAITNALSGALSAQTISGTVRAMSCWQETNATDNYTPAFAIKVVDSTGADRGILLAVTGGTNEMPTGASRPRTLRDSSDNETLTLSSVACSAGDMIVVEIGFKTGSTSTAAGNVVNQSPPTGGAFPKGPMGYADTDVGVADSWPGIAWVEFSGSIAPFSTTGVSEIRYIGSAQTPADGAAATGVADPTAVTPPGDMESGDLVLMIGHQRLAAAALAVSEASGQTWTSETAIGTTNVTARVFWCIYNGTWGANPSVDFSATTCNSVQMHVFRPPSGTEFSLNQAQVELDTAGSPATITGQTTTGTDATLTIAGWFTADDNTWGTISGTGWVDLGHPQYRNTSGSDQSSSYAWFSSTTGGATGNVTKTQLANGPDAGTTFIISFAAAAAVPESLIYDVGRLFQQVQLVR
jgi:hypothetical protein